MSNEKPAKRQEINWGVVLWCIHLHVLGLYAAWLMFTSAKWMTVFFTLFITLLGCLGVTVGAHRLWAHRTFNASSSLRLFLMLAHTLAGAGTIYNWVLYHRLHHKYYKTDKDPYNHKKGFLYSHYLGNFWTPKVDFEQAKKEIDMRDMDSDGYVWLQHKFYWIIFAIVGVLLPLNAPLEYWDESLGLTVLITGILRFAITLNVSWLVNSAMHIWGTGENNDPRFDLGLFFITKSNWLTYHYMVPWDWKNGEFGTYNKGCSTFFIKMWNELGFVDHLLSVTTHDLRAILHDVTNKKTSLQEGLDELKKISQYKAAKDHLKFQL
ncbi:acyl-CoA Delta-9 desaturase isoform X1 [Nomia melanderi]|uniref:acyl-CoA Delta-9 desaturase isoform X1 n=1 Tax=Nomia melanderi TaxID=2448451 RepID=UPI00130474DA|nr:stearoyl-CoA desaturase 5 isoform X1 [Nomia melanderi]XP_031846088.1 stearoyl-CoA desaturase 5 isoform X1 [Nomia melanderi]